VKENKLLEEKNGRLAELSSTTSVQKILAMLNQKKEAKELIKDPPDISQLSSDTIKHILEKLKRHQD
jgi:hypothetical protein